MKFVFADTVFWGAMIHPRDQYHDAAVRARASLGDVTVVTTDEVLTEFLDGLAERGPHLRTSAAQAVRRILTDSKAIVHPQSRASFLQALRLYEQRPDKGYSLVDCISMIKMREKGITEILTNDHHFVQEGFTILLR